MIALPAKTHIWVAAGVTDLQRGFTGLSGWCRRWPGPASIQRWKRRSTIRWQHRL